jgi:hypothetical protein
MEYIWSMPILYQDLKSEEKALNKSPPTDLVDLATDPPFRLFRTQGFRGVFGREDRQRAAIDVNGYRQAGRRLQRHGIRVSSCNDVCDYRWWFWGSSDKRVSFRQQTRHAAS